MAQITNGITAPMIPPIRQQQERPAVNRVTSVQIGGRPQLRNRSWKGAISAPLAIEPVDPAPPAHPLRAVDPDPPAYPLRAVDPDPDPPAPQLQPVEQALQLQPVDQTDGNHNPGQSGGQTARTLGSSNTDPDAPLSVPFGISPATLFKASLGAIFAAAQALMLHHLEQQGDSAPASSKIVFTMVCVTLLLAFLFLAIGACWYKRNPVAAYIFGNTGFLCITLSFFAMMHVWVPKHLVWLVWTVCGILLLGFAYFFAQDLKGFYAEWRRTAAPARSEV